MCEFFVPLWVIGRAKAGEPGSSLHRKLGLPKRDYPKLLEALKERGASLKRGRHRKTVSVARREFDVVHGPGASKRYIALGKYASLSFLAWKFNLKSRQQASDTYKALNGGEKKPQVFFWPKLEVTPEKVKALADLCNSMTEIATILRVSRKMIVRIARENYITLPDGNVLQQYKAKKLRAFMKELGKKGYSIPAMASIVRRDKSHLYKMNKRYGLGVPTRKVP